MFVSELGASAFARLCEKALKYGALWQPETLYGASIQWDTAGSCENPTERQFIGLIPGLTPSKDYHKIRNRDLQEIKGRATLQVRCRKCQPCKRHKSKFWAARATSEVQAHPRTRFLTGTLSPYMRHFFRMRAPHAIHAEAWGKLSYKARSALLRELPTDTQKQHWELLSKPAQDRALLRVVNHRIDGYLARVRRRNPGKFRYMLVYETHKDGELHVHALIHDDGKHTSPSERDFRLEWRKHFMSKVFQIKTVENDQDAPWYCCKYISKSMMGRVRCSLSYGGAFTSL